MLSYEHAIRKHAYKVMATAGYSFGAALLHAYKEPSVKERNFTTPLALHAKRPQPWNANTDLPPTKKGRKGAKGNGKGKDDKGAKKLKEGSDRTPDGKPICFRYNAKGCKKGAKCHFAHVCMLCFGKHPASDCLRRSRIRTLGPATLRTDPLPRQHRCSYLRPPLPPGLPRQGR